MQSKKFISLLAIIAMMMLCAIGVQAEETIDVSNGYTITQDGTYKLSSSATVTMTGKIVVEEGVTATLDLNGATITADGNAINNYGTLTITGNGTINSGRNTIYNTGTMVIENGTFTGSENCIYNGENYYDDDLQEQVLINASLTINGGSFRAGEYNAIYNAGTVLVKEGTFTAGSDGLSIMFDSNEKDATAGKTTIENGTFYGNISHGPVLGELNISDGTFYGSIYGAETISGGIFNADPNGSNGSVSAKTVTGGIFNSPTGTLSVEEAVSGCTVYGTISGEAANQIPFASGDTYVYGRINGYPKTKVDDAIIHTGPNTTYSVEAVNRGYAIVNNIFKSVGACRIEVKAGDNCKSIAATSTDDTNKYIYYWKGPDKEYVLSYYTGTYATITKGQTAILRATPTSKDDTDDITYEFKGWYTTSDGIGIAVSTDEILNIEYTPEENTTLYAVYEAVETSVATAKKAQAEAWLNTYDGYASGTSFDITSKEDMEAFAYAVNILGYNFSQKTVKLKEDLDYTNDTFTIIGYKKDYKASDGTTVKGKYFSGTFNGNGKTISKVTLSDDTYVGLFGYAKNATITDLTVKDSSFSAPKATGYVGAFVGMGSNITLTNCKSVNNTLTYGYHVGGMVGNATGLTLNNAEVSGLTITASTMKDGAIVGYVCDLTVNGATVSGIKTTENTTGYVGAVAGHVNTGTNTLNNIVVDTPNLYLISTTYSGTKKVTLSGDNTNVTAKGIVKELVEDVTFTIEGGTYTVGTIVNSFGSDGSYFGGHDANVTLNINGGTFENIKTVYNTITDNATANVESSLVDNGESGITTELLKQCTDEGGFIQDSEGNWVLEKANITASAPTDKEEQLRTHIDAYVDENGLGNLRVITDVSMTGTPDIEKYGTWFIATRKLTELLFTGGKTVEVTVGEPQEFVGNQFASDLMGIQAANFDDEITAISYVKPTGLEIRQVTFTTTLKDALAHHRDLQ